MLSTTETLAMLGGIARGAQLQQLGFSRQTLSREVQRGSIDRIRAGVFALPSIEPDVRSAAAHGGALTCTSVLRAAGVWVLPSSSAPHVWIVSGRRAHAHPGCCCVAHHHRGASILGRVPVEQALLHLRHCAGDEAFFAAYESAWRLRLLDGPARRRIRDALPRSARWLVDLARNDADSGLESLLRLRLHIVGIELRCQVTIDGVGRVDFVIAGVVIIETDGKANHDTPALRHKDLVRDAAASRRGYETLRFDYAQVVHDWPTVLSAITAAVGRAKARA